MHISYPAHRILHNASHTPHNAQCFMHNVSQRTTHHAHCTTHIAQCIPPLFSLFLAPAHLLSSLSSKPYKRAKSNQETASTTPLGAVHKGSIREMPLSPALLGPEKTVPSLAPHPGRLVPTADTHVLPPPPYSSPTKPQSFQAGAGTNEASACALCLGRHFHDIQNCRSESLWDGGRTRCKKNEGGRLVNPTRTVLCHNWNSRRGCSATGHEQRHECTGCGQPDHGAQKCPRAQKAPGAHTI